ncbi:hypothetical protein F4678DRAFT_478916 [Xylaria arbuscula]|nr:hypothetical protein F4678DRAFT_478916 [Xylaria arbuscula]
MNSLASPKIATAMPLAGTTNYLQPDDRFFTDCFRAVRAVPGDRADLPGSAQGHWKVHDRYRLCWWPMARIQGHPPNITTNTLNMATNADTGKMNVASQTALEHDPGPWVVVAEQNYDEDSARELKALQPRYLSNRVVLTNSFARIHEPNFKKQGVVPDLRRRRRDCWAAGYAVQGG